MDNFFDMKCNRLTCRLTLTDKAVVTTCSHIFCVDCANELFNAARLCPACETALTEPDDVVICSLHPTNDYKTSVLSGLSPAMILEICSRAIGFWQYQSHQELSFQTAVARSLNDKNAQLQKQLDNVVREANNEIGLLSSKLSELERDLELERRKVREAQEVSRERDREYQKLKGQYEKIKRKALLAPAVGNGLNLSQNNEVGYPPPPQRANRPLAAGAAVDLGAVIGGMEANGIHRTPLGNRVVVNNHSANLFKPQQPPRSGWQQEPQAAQAHIPAPQSHKHRSHKHHPRPATAAAASESASENEVETYLFGFSKPRQQTHAKRHASNPTTTNWARQSTGTVAPANPQGSGPTPFAPPRKASGFKPAVSKR